MLLAKGQPAKRITRIFYVFRIPMSLPGFLLDAMVRVSQRPAYKGFIDNYDPVARVILEDGRENERKQKAG